MSVIVLLIGGLWAPMVGKFEHIFQYFQQCWAFVAIPSMIIFVFGILWKRFSNTAALVTLLFSFPMFLMPYIIQLFNIDANAYIVAGYSLIFLLITAVLISLLTAGSVNPEASQHIFKREMLYLPEELKRGKFRFLKSVGLWAFIMIALYVLIYVNLW